MCNCVFTTESELFMKIFQQMYVLEFIWNTVWPWSSKYD